MDFGALRDLVTLQTFVETQDENTGVITQGWGDFAVRIPADIQPVSVREFVASQANQGTLTTRIVIRYRAGVKSSMRAIDVRDGTVYELIGPPLPDPKSGREYLTLACRVLEEGA